MGFMKNGAIKSTTKKRLHQLIDLIINNPETDPMDTLNGFVLGLRVQGMSIEIPSDVKSWELLLRYLVYFMVRNELAYDSTMGSKEDFDLITETMNEEMVKLKQEFNGARM